MSLKRISKYIQLIRNSVYLLRFTKNLKSYGHEYVSKFLEPYYTNYHKKLLPETENKIYRSTALAIPVFIHLVSYLQRGKDLSETETEKSILAGIITAVYDDLLDLNQIAVENQKQMFLHPENYPPIMLEDAIVKGILDKINELGVLQPDRYQFIKERIYDAQIISLKQLDKNTSVEELVQISNDKNLWALIWYCNLMDEKVDDNIDKTMNMLGLLSQLADDCLDVYKDYQDGIRTIPNICEDFEAFEAKFTEDIIAYCKCTRSLGFEKNRTEFFLNMTVLLVARAIVVTQQFIKLQKKIGKGPLPFDKLPKEVFKVDLYSTANKLRLLKVSSYILSR
jgi:hypothetical protein